MTRAYYNISRKWRSVTHPFWGARERSGRRENLLQTRVAQAPACLHWPLRAAKVDENLARHVGWASRPALWMGCSMSFFVTQTSGLPSDRSSSPPAARCIRGCLCHKRAGQSIAETSSFAAKAGRPALRDLFPPPQKLNLALRTMIRGSVLVPVIRPKVVELMFASGLEKLA
jgi:hypothetical protein